MLTQYRTVFIMIFVTLWVPLVFNYFGYVFIEGRWIQFSLHSLVEVVGAVLALVIAIILADAVRYRQLPPVFKWVAQAFLALAILDIVHAAMNVETLFVWFHSISSFFASLILLMGVVVQKTRWSTSPPSKRMVSLFVAVFALLSIQFNHLLPDMTDNQGEFTLVAIMMNVLAGTMFEVSSIYFIVQYFRHHATAYLMMAGFGFLMVASELSFAISSLWDFSWWGWHILRMVALVSLSWYFYELLKNKIDAQLDTHRELETQLQSLRQQLLQVSQYSQLLDKTSLVSKSDLDGNITEVNDRLLESTGYRREELLGQPHSIFKGGYTNPSAYETLWKTIQSGDLWTGQLQNRKKNGDLFMIKIAILPIKNEAGEVVEYLAARQDITDAIEQQDRLTHYQTVDDLTGFKTRYQLVQDIEARKIEKIALLNIDDSKEINDFFGLVVGNELIRQVGQYLAKIKDPALRIYRMHGDEFALATSMNHPMDKFEAKIGQWVNALSEVPFDVAGQTLYITVKAGIAEGLDTALTAADMALKVAKKTHRPVVTQNETYLFSHRYKENMIWIQTLKQALADDGILLVYQPIYDLQNQANRGFECLVRLDKDGAMVEPAYFLEVAKKSRLYDQLSQCVMRLAFEAFHDRAEAFSINICAEDMVNEQTFNHLQQLCQNYYCADRLTLEFTEQEAYKNLDAAIQFVQSVKRLGVQIAIDDVEKGVMDFEALLKLQPNCIKIEGRLIAHLLETEQDDTASDAEVIISTLVGFAHQRNISVVAERVESQSQFLKLKALKVDCVQGFFTGKPTIIITEPLKKA